jgi:hypothetical protein
LVYLLGSLFGTGAPRRGRTIADDETDSGAALAVAQGQLFVAPLVFAVGFTNGAKPVPFGQRLAVAACAVHVWLSTSLSYGE